MAKIVPNTEKDVDEDNPMVGDAKFQSEIIVTPEEIQQYKYNL
jgi:hypothetical protein